MYTLLRTTLEHLCVLQLEGGVVYRQKRGEEARGFSTVRGAPQNGDGQVEANFAIMRLTAQLGRPGHKWRRPG